jgi:hypothetical protein
MLVAGRIRRDRPTPDLHPGDALVLFGIGLAIGGIVLAIGHVITACSRSWRTPVGAFASRATFVLLIVDFPWRLVIAVCALFFVYCHLPAGHQGHARSWIVFIAVRATSWTFIALVRGALWFGWPIVKTSIRLLWPLKDCFFFCWRKLNSNYVSGLLFVFIGSGFLLLFELWPIIRSVVLLLFELWPIIALLFPWELTQIATKLLLVLLWFGIELAWDVLPFTSFRRILYREVLYIGLETARRIGKDLWELPVWWWNPEPSSTG